MMGMSQVLSAQKRAVDSFTLFRRAVIRGAFIFLVGIFMLALAWGPGHMWQWDILTLMGAATVLLFLCRFLSPSMILLLALIVAVATPCLRLGIDYAALWGGKPVPVPVISQYLPGIMIDPAGEFKGVWTMKDVLTGFLFTGEFPVFPWALFPLVGFVLGRRIVGGRMQNDLPFLLIIGSLLVCLGLGGAYASLFHPGSSAIGDYIAPLSFYPDSFTMISYQLGMALLGFSAVYFFYDGRKKDPSKIRFLVGLYLRASRSSLTFYFLHFLLIGWPLAVILLITGRNLKYASLSAFPAVLAGLAGVTLLQLLLFFWEKHGSKYSLEWWLGAITSRLTKN